MLSVPGVLDTLLCRLQNNLPIRLFHAGQWRWAAVGGCVGRRGFYSPVVVQSPACRLLLLRGERSWVIAASRVGSYHCIISLS